MAKAKTTTQVDVNASLDDLWDGFTKITLVSHTGTKWIYQGETETDKLVIEGRGFNKTGTSIGEGEVTSVHLRSGDVTLLDVDYGKHPAQGSGFINSQTIFAVISNALRGNDRVTGGAGDDYITAGDGRDVIKAGGGSNSIDGGKGNDRIDVIKGNDSILLTPTGGTDKILHFDADGLMGSQDMIWAFFSECNIVADGKNTIIELKDHPDELHLIGVKSTDITESDFLF
jgi:hypothetical protein